MATRKARWDGEIHEYTQRRTSPGLPAVARLDTKSNPLVQAVSQKIRLVANQRGLSIDDLATTLGVDLKILRPILNETALPGPELAHRIVQWFQDPSLTWKYRARLKSNRGIAADRVNGKWSQRRIWLPANLEAKLRSAAAATGYSEEAFIQIAISRFLEHEPTLATMKQAIVEVEKLLIQRAINNNPNLWAILEMEDRLIPKEMPTKLRNAQPEQSPLLTQQIAETPVFDGPATPIANDDDLIEELF